VCARGAAQDPNVEDVQPWEQRPCPLPWVLRGPIVRISERGHATCRSYAKYKPQHGFVAVAIKRVVASHSPKTPYDYALENTFEDIAEACPRSPAQHRIARPCRPTRSRYVLAARGRRRVRLVRGEGRGVST